MGPDALQTQLEDLKDQMEAIEEMNKKVSEEREGRTGTWRSRWPWRTSSRPKQRKGEKEKI